MYAATLTKTSTYRATSTANLIRFQNATLALTGLKTVSEGLFRAVPGSPTLFFDDKGNDLWVTFQDCASCVSDVYQYLEARIEQVLELYETIDDGDGQSYIDYRRGECLDCDSNAYFSDTCF